MTRAKANWLAMLITFVIRRLKEFAFLSDFDPVQLYAGIVSIGCGWVLLVDPDYMRDSPRLLTLLEKAPQPIWMYVLFVGGGAQLFVFLMTGCPGFFCRDHAKVHNVVIRWYIASIVVEIGGLTMYSTLATLLSFDGPSWATVLFGATAMGCLWASCRLGALISVEQEYIRQKQLYEATRQVRSGIGAGMDTGIGAGDYLRQYRL